MTEYLSLQDLLNAHVDAKTLEDVMNGSASEVVRARLGRTYPTVAALLAVIDNLRNQGISLVDLLNQNLSDLRAEAATLGTGVVAYPKFADLPASTTANASAFVANDPDQSKNGMYYFSGGQWVKFANEWITANNLLNYASDLRKPFIYPSTATLPDGSGAGQRAHIDLTVQPVAHFVDNVLSIQNLSYEPHQDGTQVVGNAAIIFRGRSGVEYGAVGYSYNPGESDIYAPNPRGYIPNMLYVEVGSFSNTTDYPTDFGVVCTLKAGNRFFPNQLTYLPFQHSARYGTSYIRGRGAGYQIQLDGVTLVKNNLSVGDLSLNEVASVNHAMSTTAVRYRERNQINKCSITTNLKLDGSVDDKSVDSWEFNLGNGSAWIGRKEARSLDDSPTPETRRLMYFSKDNKVFCGLDETTKPGFDGAVNINTPPDAGTALCVRSTRAAVAPAQIIHHAKTNGDNTFISFATEVEYTPRGSITFNRAAGEVAYNKTSDRRAKDIHGELEGALDKIMQLKPYLGRMHGASLDTAMLIADELQEVMPEAVTGEKDAVDENGNPVYQQIDVTKTLIWLIGAFQEYVRTHP